MAKYNIYVRQALDETIQSEARRLGVSPKDVIRLRLESGAAKTAMAEILNDFQRTRASILGIVKLLENLAPEIAYMGAVSRLSTKQNETYFQLAQAAEKQVGSLISAIKKNLEEASSDL